MTDPITRLNATLEGHHGIERELGEGGIVTTVDLIRTMAEPT